MVWYLMRGERCYCLTLLVLVQKWAIQGSYYAKRAVTYSAYAEPQPQIASFQKDRLLLQIAIHIARRRGGKVKLTTVCCLVSPVATLAAVPTAAIVAGALARNKSLHLRTDSLCLCGGYRGLTEADKECVRRQQEGLCLYSSSVQCLD